MPLRSITNLTISISKPDLDEDSKLQLICETTKVCIPNTNRVSIWLFNETYDAIHCIKCLDENNKTTSGLTLSKADYPEYFDFILNERVLSAPDATTNPATRCFNVGYFDVLNIKSLLDYIFHYEFQPTGVICCEKVGEPTEWTQDDIDNLRRISNVTSMFLSEDK